MSEGDITLVPWDPLLISPGARPVPERTPFVSGREHHLCAGVVPTIAMCRQPEAQPLQPKSCFLYLNHFVQMSFQQDNIQKILLSLTSRIAETHLAHEKRRILSMYRLFVLLLLKELPEGLGNTWAFFVRDVVYSLLRIITDGKQVIKRPRQQQQQQVRFVADDDLFLPCCNLLYYVCKSAVECCSEVRTVKRQLQALTACIDNQIAQPFS